MAVELLVRAVTDAKAVKGAIQTIRADSELVIRPWARLETLPRFVQVRVSNATLADVNNYTESLRTVFNWELLNENVAGRQYRVFIHPRLVQLFGARAHFPARLRAWLENQFGAFLVSADLEAGEATFNFPNQDWQLLRDRIMDAFEAPISKRRFFIDPDDVDTAINAGGRITVTKGQLSNRLRDRLVD